MTEQEKKELAAKLAAKYAAKKATEDPTPAKIEIAKQANTNVGDVRDN